MYKSGQIKEKITEERLKMFLEQMNPKKEAEKIIVGFIFLSNFIDASKILQFFQ